MGNLFGRASLAVFGGSSFADLSWEPPKDLAGRTVDAGLHRLQATIDAAERFLKSGNPTESVKLLAPEQTRLSDYGR